MKTYFKGLLAVLTGVIALSLFAQNPALGIDYTITDLGTLGGTKSEAYGINNLNEVVGMAYLPGNIAYHAFLYSGGVMTDLGTLCPTLIRNSYAYRINDSGQISGTTCKSPGDLNRAFLYSGGVMSDLGTLGGSGSFANGINNSGHVVGSAALAGDAATHAFVYKDGVMNDIGTLNNAWSSQAYAINDYGQIVGWSRYNASTATTAFFYSGDVMTDITPGAGSGIAYDINNSGQIVGAKAFSANDSHAFLYGGGALTDLGTLRAGGGEARGINDHGQIVGWSYVPGPIPHAFLYESGVMIDLNTLLPPGSGWVLNYAYDINDKGRIVGVGTIDGQSHAFLMVPLIPEIELNPTSLDFGTMTTGTSLTKEATIENLGTVDLTVASVTLCTGTSNEFSWTTTFPLTVSPGSSAVFSVTYTPADEGTDTGCLEINSNDPYTPAAQLSLSGTGELPRPVINLNPPALDFGSVRVGTSATLPSAIQNLGTADLTVSNIARCTGTSTEFSWSPITLPSTIAPGGSVTLSVTYGPANAGIDTGCIQITSDDSLSPVVNLSLTGRAQPRINLNPSTLDFASTGPSTKWTQIQNLGTADLNISDIGYCAGTSQEFTWSRTRLPLTVVPGGSTTLSVTYTPVDVGTDTGCLAIRSNDPATNPANLTLVGKADVDFQLKSFSAMLYCPLKTDIYVKFTIQVSNPTPVKGLAQARLVGKAYDYSHGNIIEFYNQTIIVDTPPKKTKSFSNFPLFYFKPPYPIDIYSAEWTVTIYDANVDKLEGPTTLSSRCK
ncbi:MAG: hypothetical protein A2157_02665 [Deltaproteobacteria bacterium RBG_16_47_11]|nr:MAG: hypothetical protein A2157_02665 [Deltaproteobacteria bacterium RBG_16_47_11]